MDTIIAIIFGIVQGATEFLPVSSSGHLLLLHKLFPGFQFGDALAFDVALHMGTLAAVVWFFWKDCWRYFGAFLASLAQAAGGAKLFPNEPSLQKPSEAKLHDQRIAWYLIVATVPAGFVGFFFEDIIEQWFWSTAIVTGIMFILVGMLFLVVERHVAKDTAKFKDTFKEMRWAQAVIIGCAQVLALIPGTSRSGITLVAGMMTGMKREESARFSFLLSVPLIAGAGLKKGLDLASVGVATSELPLLVLGAISAGIVGYIVIAALLKYLSNKTLRPFAWYRIALGVLILLITVV